MYGSFAFYRYVNYVNLTQGICLDGGSSWEVRMRQLQQRFPRFWDSSLTKMGMYRRYTSKVGPNPAFVEPHPTCLPPFQEPWDMLCDTWSSSCHQLMISEWIIYQLLEFLSQIWSQSNLDPKPTKQEMRIIINKTHIGRVKHTAC